MVFVSGVYMVGSCACMVCTICVYGRGLCGVYGVCIWVVVMCVCVCVCARVRVCV